jgi:hypothetical protein
MYSLNGWLRIAYIAIPIGSYSWTLYHLLMYDSLHTLFQFWSLSYVFLSPLVGCEARAEAKYLTIEPLFLVTVDSQKAFDVVDHIIMLDTYYENIQNHPLNRP